MIYQLRIDWRLGIGSKSVQDQFKISLGSVRDQIKIRSQDLFEMDSKFI